MSVKQVTIHGEFDLNLSHWEAHSDLLAQAVDLHLSNLGLPISSRNIGKANPNKGIQKVLTSIIKGANADEDRANGSGVAFALTSAGIVSSLNAALNSIDGRTGALLRLTTSVDRPVEVGAPGIVIAPTSDLSLVFRGAGVYSLNLLNPLADTASLVASFTMQPVRTSDPFFGDSISAGFNVWSPNEARQDLNKTPLELDYKADMTFDVDSPESPSVATSFQAITDMSGGLVLAGIDIKKNAAPWAAVQSFGTDDASRRPDRISPNWGMSFNDFGGGISIGGAMFSRPGGYPTGKTVFKRGAESYTGTISRANGNVRNLAVALTITNSTGAQKDPGHICDIEVGSASVAL